MITVETEKDRVVVVFGRRGRDLQLTPDQAEQLAAELERVSNLSEAWVNAGGSRVLLKGQNRGVMVKSWDGKVNVRFDSIIDRESIPYEAARLIAREIKAKIVEARHYMTFQWAHTET